MFIDQLLSQTAVPMLEQVMQFTAARHNVLANNIANIDVPGYRMQDLPVADFQQALRRAADEKAPTGRLVLNGRAVRTGDDGRLVVQPTATPGHNFLHVDQGNRQVEKQMTALAENTLTYNIAAELLRKQFDGLKTAIRQRM